MNYYIEDLIRRIEDGERFKYLFFWGHQPSKDGSIIASCFSQWWESEFEFSDHVYKTAEHWMMAKKAELFDKSYLEQILQANSPAKAKALGRKLTGFSQEVWDRHKYEIVKQGTMLKFSQNKKLLDFLLGTGDRILVEASPVDPVWGIGLPKDHPDACDPSKWKGENLLGFALMEVRDELI